MTTPSTSVKLLPLNPDTTFTKEYENIKASFINIIMQINMLQPEEPTSTPRQVIETKDMLHIQEWQTFLTKMHTLFPKFFKTCPKERVAQGIAYLTFQRIESFDVPLDSTSTIHPNLTQEQGVLCAKFCIEWLKYHPIDIYYKTYEHQDPMLLSFICNALCNPHYQDKCFDEMLEFVKNLETQYQQKSFLGKIFKILCRKEDLSSYISKCMTQLVLEFHSPIYEHVQRVIAKQPSCSEDECEVVPDLSPWRSCAIPLDNESHTHAFLKKYINQCINTTTDHIRKVIEIINTYKQTKLRPTPKATSEKEVGSQVKARLQSLDHDIHLLTTLLTKLTKAKIEAYLTNRIILTPPHPFLLMNMLEEKRNYMLSDNVKARLKTCVTLLLQSKEQDILTIMLKYDPKSFFTLFAYCNHHKGFSTNIARQIEQWQPAQSKYEQNSWESFLNEALFHNCGALITKLVTEWDFIPRCDWTQNYRELMTLKINLPIAELKMDQSYVMLDKEEEEDYEMPPEK